jgi:type II secretory pathway predicted ATPase ExeA
MVTKFYKLREHPFGVTPDPRYLFLSLTHREALASIVYGVTSGRGFTALIAKPGMGKTTILFNFLNMMRDHAKTVFLFQAQCSPQDLLRSLLADIGIEDDGGDMVRLQRKLNDCLLRESRQGKRLIVVIDEAQNLDEPVLEVVRMLSNFETSREKLLHLILSGQPQLADKLAGPRLVQLKQRISIVSRLKPFTEEETQAYVDHRLRMGGYDFAAPLFTKRAMEMLASYSQGIPRNINNLCFNAMSIGCVAKQKTIDTDIIWEVIHDLDLRTLVSEPEAGSASKDSPKDAKLIASSPSFLSRLRGWSMRLAFAAVVLMVTLSGNRIRMKPKSLELLASTPSYVPAGPTAAAKSPQRGPSADPVRVANFAPNTEKPGDVSVVVVLPHENLYRIILKRFGKYDAQVLAAVYALNPGLTDPRGLRVGQHIRIPVAHSLAAVSKVSSQGLGAGANNP